MERIRKVQYIHPKRAEALIKEYHYSGTCPSIMHAFGLIINNDLEGVCCFSTGATRTLMEKIHKQNWGYLELIRSCLIHNEHNDASFMIGNALKLLPKSYIIVSYADIFWNHAGKIYQSTNWLYTGIGAVRENYLLDGVPVHKKTLWGRMGNFKKETRDRVYGDRLQLRDDIMGKHRYFYCLGRNKYETKLMKQFIDENYKIQPYPSEDSKRYVVEEIKQNKIDLQKLKPLL